jgi:hypothetical protein
MGAFSFGDDSAKLRLAAVGQEDIPGTTALHDPRAGGLGPIQPEAESDIKPARRLASDGGMPYA